MCACGSASIQLDDFVHVQMGEIQPSRTDRYPHGGIPCRMFDLRTREHGRVQAEVLIPLLCPLICPATEHFPRALAAEKIGT